MSKNTELNDLNRATSVNEIAAGANVYAGKLIGHTIQDTIYESKDGRIPKNS